MKNREFKQFLSQLKTLTFKQKTMVSETLKHSKPIDGTLGNLGTTNECRHCHSKEYYRWGYESGIQRYKCKSCGRTYNALTNTPLSRLRKKEQWATNANEMIAGSSIQATANACRVSNLTAFRWRHRFLKLLSTASPSCLKGIIEADETYFLESHKGERGLKSPRKRGGKASKRGLSKDQVPVIVARDRSGQTLSQQLSAVTSSILTNVLKPIIAPGSVLCTDGNNVFPIVSDKCGTLHKHLNIKAGVKVIDKVYHIQNVNAYDSRLKGWMKRFHGVATKYLQDYLGWWRVLDSGDNLRPMQFLKAVISPENTFPRIALI